jgi:hypothetical protein
MKKGKIEKLIFENKEEFNQLKAPTGLWDKIEKKLPPVETEKSSKVVMLRIMKIAAVSIGLLISGILIGKIYFSKSNPQFDEHLNQTIEQTEDYFGTLIDYKLKEAKSQDLLDEKLLNHLSALEKEYEELKNRLNESPNLNNDQLVNQMTKNYKLRLSLIDLLLDKGKVKSEKPINLNKKDKI